MSLRPCPSCRRHVASADRTCPFCGAACVASYAAPLPAKLTRAAIFATAALGAPACWTGKAAETTPPDTTHERGSGDGTHHTQVTHVPDAGMGTIVVTIVDNNGNPLAGRQVHLSGGQNPASPDVVTDARGQAMFRNVPPGSYRVESHDGHPRHSPSVAGVVVKSGEVAASTLTVYIPPYSPTPMPYGAPPSRRRVV